MNSPVKQNKNGTLSWNYDVYLLKDFSILILVYKVLFLSCFICFFLMSCIAMCEDGLDGVRDMMPGIKFLLITVLVVLVLGLLGYFIYAAVMGWKYCVQFTMDEKQLVHEQIPEQEKKAKKISFFLLLAGLFAKRPSAVGTAMTSATHTKTISTFENVKLVKAVRRYNMIKVNERLFKNRVYVIKEDYDFVLDFIIQHCPNAKIKV